ncbi:MAG: hypothetical protein FJ102_10130 [Deltaproteobacteria bacterium]|nr:hypothetical protein [Deltaproteobacteria bacterium]
MLPLLLLACTRDAGTPEGATVTEDGTPVATQGCSAVANLELVPLDIWGRDLTDAALALDHAPSVVLDPDAGPGVMLIRLGTADASLQVIASAEEHHDHGVRVDWDGEILAVDGPAVGRVAASTGTRRVDGEDCLVHTVYLGLDHRWFAASGRAPTMNRFELLRDGEDFWAAVAAGLGDVERRVAWATWWWESDFELERDGDHVSSSRSERDATTSMARLQGLQGVERRLLVNRFWDENSDYAEYLNTDAELRDAAESAGDDFEVVLQGNDTEVPLTGRYEGEAADYDFAARVLQNPRYADRAVERAREAISQDLAVEAASWHQKFVVLDGEVAFVSGMNTKGADWDSHDHAVFDPRRMTIDATTSDREDVEDELAFPDYGPRKDYGARVEGPAARDVEDVFHERWEAAIDGDALYADVATRFSLDEAPEEPAGGVPVQVVATLPEPWAEMSILDAHLRAIAQAESYIYVEDQYFRSTLLNDAIVARMTEVPELVLVVVTKPISDWDPGAQYTWLSDATFRELFPDRYLLLQLRSTEMVIDTDWWDEVVFESQDMDVHSKIRIVDDRWLSVGSCNFNNRGYLYEGEMDVVVYDRDVVTAARRDIFANLVGPDWEGELTDDPRQNLEVLRDAAGENQLRWDWWAEYGPDLDVDDAEAEWQRSRPSGFVYPLEMDHAYEWDVGPDLF